MQPIKPMFNRKKLYRERLEFFIIQHMMRYRALFLICGMLLLMLAALGAYFSPVVTLACLCAAALILLNYASFESLTLWARILAWVFSWRFDNDKG